jgi:hypothetical protein
MPSTKETDNKTNTDAVLIKAKEAAFRSTYIPKSVRKNFSSKISGASKFKKKP